MMRLACLAHCLASSRVGCLWIQTYQGDPSSRRIPNQTDLAYDPARSGILGCPSGREFDGGAVYVCNAFAVGDKPRARFEPVTVMASPQPSFLDALPPPAAVVAKPVFLGSVTRTLDAPAGAYDASLAVA
jgi:hypothetical protein